MPQCTETNLLTRLVEHATLSESGPIRTCSYTRNNPWSLKVVLIVACQKHVIILSMIRLEEYRGFQGATISDQEVISDISACIYRARFA